MATLLIKKPNKHRFFQLRTFFFFFKCPELRSEEPLGPLTPHGVNTVKKKRHFHERERLKTRAWEKCFGRCDEERWGDCEGCRRAREWKMWWITPTVKQKRVCVCVLVTPMCSKLKTNLAGTIKNQLPSNRRNGAVFIRSRVDRWHP